MKNVIKIGLLLTLVLMGLVACEKSENNESIVEKEESLLSVSIQVETKGRVENALLIGTKEELEMALLKKSEQSIHLQKVANRNNLFKPVVGTGVVGPVQDPYDAVEACWQEINTIYTSNLPTWRAQANSTCNDVLVCLTCPNAGVGLYVMYVIKPTNPACFMAEISFEYYKARAFNFTKDNYESAEVNKFINSK